MPALAEGVGAKVFQSLTPNRSLHSRILPALLTRRHIQPSVETLYDGEVGRRAPDDLHELVDNGRSVRGADLGVRTSRDPRRKSGRFYKNKTRLGCVLLFEPEFRHYGCGSLPHRDL